ncbi:type II toxin-antitoxin system VapC family toxin [soil metagenome]
MILPDSAVWIDHLRAPDPVLIGLLNTRQVLGHPFVTGEIYLGSIAQRDRVLGRLRDLVQIRVATVQQVTTLIEGQQLFGAGIGYVDAHLLTSVRLTPGASLWTRDKRLHAVAMRLNIAILGNA